MIKYKNVKLCCSVCYCLSGQQKRKLHGKVISLITRHFNKCVLWLRGAIYCGSVFCYVLQFVLFDVDRPVSSRCPVLPVLSDKVPTYVVQRNKFQQVFVYLESDLSVVPRCLPNLRNHCGQRLLRILRDCFFSSLSPRPVNRGPGRWQSSYRKNKPQASLAAVIAVEIWQKKRW